VRAERLLLVTGDDLGASPAVNAAIARGHRDGVLTSASLMVAEPAAQEAVELARDLPMLATGLHLVLCDGVAASPPRAIPDLVDLSGRLPASPLVAGLRDFFQRRRLRSQLEYEVRTQFERFAKTGLSFDHVDGHHHLHMHPILFGIVQRSMEEHRVPCIRLMHEPRTARLPAGRAREEVVPTVFSALARLHRRSLARSGRIYATDAVFGLRASGRLDAPLLCALVGSMRADTVELFAHPRYDTEEGRREESALRDPSVRDAIERAGFTLASTRSFATRAGARAGGAA